MSKTVVPDRLGRRRLNAYVKAAVGDSWKGGGPPEHIPYWDYLLAHTKRKMLEHLDAQALAIVDLEERLRVCESAQCEED